MKAINNVDLWIPDEKTYNQLRKLQVFINFIIDMEITSIENKQKASEINKFFENLTTKVALKSWNITFVVYETGITKYNVSNPDYYWRTWSVGFSNNNLEIEATSNNVFDNTANYSDFNYQGIVFLFKECTFERFHVTGDLNEFVDDAKNYKKYISDGRKMIEVDIDIIK